MMAVPLKHVTIQYKYTVNFQFSQLYCAFLTLSSLFIYPTDAQLDCSKRMLKCTLIFTLKVLLHVSV